MGVCLKALHSLRMSKQLNHAGAKTSFCERCYGDTHAHVQAVRSLGYEP